MTETKNLAGALAAFQSEMPVVRKGNRANVGQYSYTYADLADVTAAAMPLLSQNGLSFMSCPRMTEHGYELVGVLLHSSGEREEGSLPIAGKTPQDWGSSITYMRRYLLGCMTGIVTDDDDDGRTAQPPAKRAAAKKAAAAEPPAAEHDSGGHPIDVEAGPIKQATRGRMFALFSDLGITDEAEQKAGMSKLLGREVTSRGSLNEGEARVVIKALEARTNSRQEQPA